MSRLDDLIALLPQNIDASYTDRSVGDKAHQQHHDYAHEAIALLDEADDDLDARMVNSENARGLGAVGDGESHPLSDTFGSLAAAQAVYPTATALTDELDHVAIQTAINLAIEKGGGAFIPTPEEGGYYRVSGSLQLGGDVLVWSDAYWRGIEAGISGATLIVGDGTNPIFTTGDYPGGAGALNRNIVLQGISGRNDGARCVEWFYANNFTMKGCAFASYNLDDTPTGEGTVLVRYSYRGVIDRCFLSCSGGGWALSARDNFNDLTIEKGCKLTGGSAGGAIDAGNGTNLKIDSPAIESSKYGIRVAWNNTETTQSFTAVAATDVLTTASAHGLSDGHTIRVQNLTGVAGLAASTDYFVRDATTTTFKLAAAEGGSAIDITSDGTGQITVGTGNVEGVMILNPYLESVEEPLSFGDGRTVYGLTVLGVRIANGSVTACDWHIKVGRCQGGIIDVARIQKRRTGTEPTIRFAYVASEPRHMQGVRYRPGKVTRAGTTVVADYGPTHDLEDFPTSTVFPAKLYVANDLNFVENGPVTSSWEYVSETIDAGVGKAIAGIRAPTAYGGWIDSIEVIEKVTGTALCTVTLDTPLGTISTFNPHSLTYVGQTSIVTVDSAWAANQTLRLTVTADTGPATFRLRIRGRAGPV